MERNNNKGFSMVELIITIAIMAILTGSFVAAAGYLKYANAKSGAKKINTELSELRIESMSKMNTPYMYLYNIGGTTYMKVVAGENANKAKENGLLDKNTTKITDGKAVTITMDKSTGAFLLGPEKIEVASVDGKSSYVIKLVKTTGRHYIEGE